MQLRGKLNHIVIPNTLAAAESDGSLSARRWRRATWMLLVLIAGASMWVYVLTMWPGYLDKLSDLGPRWYGARELLLHHRDPYSQDVSQEIQHWIFGRLAGPA